MRALAALLLTAMPIFGYASLPNPLWDLDWRPMFTDDYCMLIRRYADHSELNAEFPSLSSTTIFDSFTIRFTIFSNSRTVSDNTFSNGHLYFFLLASSLPKLSPMQQFIANVRIKSYRLKKHSVGQRSAGYTFYLEGDEAQAAFDALKRNESLTLVLELGSGQTSMLEIPNRSHNRFKVWANMLRACAEANGT